MTDRAAVDRIRARIASQEPWIIAMCDILTDPAVLTVHKARPALAMGLDVPAPWGRRGSNGEEGRPVPGGVTWAREGETVAQAAARATSYTTHDEGDLG